MLKKNLVLFLTFGLGLTAFSQEVTNVKVLQNFAQQHKLKEQEAYAKAVALAKLKGWPIYEVRKNGMVIALESIDALGNPIYYSTFNNTIAAATTKANQLWPGGSSGLNLSGSSAAVTGKLGVWDGGLILKNHVELIGRIFQKDSASAPTSPFDNIDHATHVSGTMIASGVNPIAKGMAFGMKQLIAYYGLSNDVSSIATEASNLLLSNHSYGANAGWVYDGTNYNWYGDTTVSTAKSYLFGFYDSKAQLIDSIAYNAPNYLIDFSAGNSNGNYSGAAQIGQTYLFNGTTSRTRTANIPANPTYGSIPHGAQIAKNTLVVGAVSGLPYGYSLPSDVQIAPFSSWGPTNDGRIKPDIVADGVNVTSSSASSTTSYESLSGTSMASPNATGSLLLVQEYYNQKHPSAFIRSATLKALAIHTADEAGSSPGPDYIFGYGLLNVLKATNVITSSYNQKTDTIIEKTLTSGTPYTYTVIASGSGPLKATIAWTDPKGIPDNTFLSTTPQLVHDLDLRITSGSSTYKPWVLNPNIPAAAATRGDDNLNNMEQVLVDSTVPGQSYTITVSNKGTLARGTQAFSLIVSGIGGTNYCSSGATSSTAGAKIDSVAFGGITNKNASSAGYNNYTNIIGSIQSSQTIPITVKVTTRDASANPRIIKVFIDYNQNGVFDATEMVAQSAIINANTGTLNASVTTPSGMVVGTSTLMRVIVQETSTASNITACGSYANGETEDYTLKIVSPSVDVALSGIVSPSAGSSNNTNQLLTVRITNNGSTAISNLNLSATVKSGTTTVATLTGSFPSTIAETSSILYTFQTPFATTGATTYTISATVTATGDQDASNNTLSQDITTGKTANPSGTADVCGTSVFLNVNNPSALNNYFWYDTQTNTSPLAVGNSTTSSVITSNKTYYLQTGARVQIGPADKNVYGTGGYNSAFVGFYTFYSAAQPTVLETAKIYANAAGKFGIGVHAAQKTSSGYSYVINPSDSVTVDVYPNLDGSGNDIGADYYLNLHFDNSIYSTYLIYFNCINGASVFRNNNVLATTTTTPYPIGNSNIFQVLNTVVTTPDNYYYFLYNMKFRVTDSLSDRVAITAVTAPTPVVTQSGNNLVSSVTNATSYQWYTSSGSAITGATGSTYTPTQSGSYYITITDAYGCQRTSNVFAYVVTAIVIANNDEIALKTTPNPSNGTFNVSFTVNTKSNVNVELINTAGQACMSNAYNNFAGQFSKQYNVNVPSGTYIVKVQQNNKVYRQKIMIIK